MSSRLVALLVTTVLAGAGSASAEEIAGGEVRRHAFQLAAGEALDAVVEQEGIDLVVELRDARDAVLMTVDLSLIHISEPTRPY